MRVVEVEIPVRTVSEMNQRDHWAKRHRRLKKHKAAAFWLVNSTPRPKPPVTIVLTRIGKKLLDPDNLAGSFKGVQDGVAMALGVDDGDSEKVKWDYRQEIGKKYAVVARIEEVKDG